MKKIRYTWILLVALLTTTSCNDFLDPEADGTLTEKDIFTNYNRSHGFINNIYNYIPGGFYSVSDAMLACGVDEAKNVNNSSGIMKLTDGSMTAKDFPESGRWTHFYTGIRKTNVFLENVDDAIFVNSQIAAEDPGANDRYRIQYKGEAYFLQGLFYFELVKRFGGVPLLPEHRLDITDDMTSISRASYDDCIKHIVELCDRAAGLLPNAYNTAANDRFLGRANKASAYALKSRALLYAASKLNNPSGDVERWKSAAAAAKSVLDMPEYGLMQSSDPKFEDMLGIWKEKYNKEVLFATSANVDNNVERREFPFGLSYIQAQGGQGNTNPTHNFVKEFETADGHAVNWAATGGASGAKEMYQGLDPRFYYFIAYNGCQVHKKKNDYFLATGVRQESGLEKDPSSTKTGYYLRKFVDTNANIKDNQDSPTKFWIIFRYAEILLNYAEAMNEAYGPTEKPSGYMMSALDALNEVRNRVGMPDYEVTHAADQTALREGIRHERMIELCFEEHRFYDVRRWDIGEQVFNKSVSGIRIEGDSKQVTSWKEFEIESRSFSKKMNLYPIPYTEMLRTTMAQNPGWE